MPVNSSVIVAPTVPATGFSVVVGAPVPKLERLKIMSDGDWESFIQEWATSGLAAAEGYSEVHRCGGGGDMGRDVVAYTAGTTSPYDNYQCKFYNHALYPSDVWLEIGKLCYYTFKGEYAVPRKYRFVAPQGVGTTLLRLLEKPEELRRQFLESWTTACANSIIGGSSIPLSDELKAHINGLDFGIFGAVPPATLVEQHSRTPFHVARFGSGLPCRVDEEGPSEDVGDHEARYVRQLLDVYGEDACCGVACVDDLGAMDKGYGTHLQASREEFFSAECLNKFSRDYLPPGCFGELQRDVSDGVREVLDENHSNGLARVRATTKQAKMLPIEGHPLRDVIRPRDKAGICHQLANDDQVRWIREE